MTQYLNAWAKREKIPVTPEKITGIAITKPGMDIKLSEALKRYSVPTLAVQLKTYYDKQEIAHPGFERMDRIEQLMYHAELRKDVSEKFKEVQKKAEELKTKEQAAKLKAAEEKGRKAASQTQKTQQNENQ